MQRVSPSPKPSPPSKTPKFFGVFESGFIFRLRVGIYNAAAPLITRVALITHNRPPALPGGFFSCSPLGDRFTPRLCGNSCATRNSRAPSAQIIICPPLLPKKAERKAKVSYKKYEGKALTNAKFNDKITMYYYLYRRAPRRGPEKQEKRGTFHEAVAKDSGCHSFNGNGLFGLPVRDLCR